MTRKEEIIKGESEEIKIYFDENGIAREYDDTYDITIHCESKEDYDELLNRLNRCWIPVSERYPTDANKSYLVCYEDGCITIEHLYFDGDGNPFFSEMELGVEAWMPLPEPYTEGGTQHDD